MSEEVVGTPVNSINDADVNASVSCPAVGVQTVDLCVPVMVMPHAMVGQTRVICCGNPIITPGNNCPISPITECGFTIRQRVCVEVPVEFGADANALDVHVHCDTAMVGVSCDELCNMNYAAEENPIVPDDETP